MNVTVAKKCMNKICMLVCAAAVAIGSSVYSEIQSAVVISRDSTGNNVVIPHELKDFLDDFKRATSKDILSSLTGQTVLNAPIATDWETATTFM